MSSAAARKKLREQADRANRRTDPNRVLADSSSISASAANAAAVAAAAFSLPSQTEPAVDPHIAEAIDQVEQLLEQSDVKAAEQLLRSPMLLGSLKPADITPAHAALVPAIELMGQCLLGRGRTKDAFQIRIQINNNQRYGRMHTSSGCLRYQVVNPAINICVFSVRLWICVSVPPYVFLNVVVWFLTVYWLRACCLIQPDGGAEKWMYYGQLIGGRDALQAYKQGLQCMLKNQSVLKENMKQAQHRAATNAFTMGEFDSVETLQLKLKASDKQISSAYTSMSELYVTDLCDEPEAETECEKLLTLALQASSDNPDALYACANLRTIQQRLPEAREVMQKLFQAIEACRASSIETIPFLKLADDQRDKNLPEIIANNDVSYELRVASAKLALELEAYEPALELLEQLLDEDDRIIEVLHLASVCAYHTHAFSSSLEYCEKAERLLATEEDSGMDDEEDAEENDEQRERMEQEEIDATKRALAELKRQVKEAIKNAPPEPEVEEGEEEDDEEHKQNGNAMQDAQGSAMED